MRSKMVHIFVLLNLYVVVGLGSVPTARAIEASGTVTNVRAWNGGTASIWINGGAACGAYYKVQLVGGPDGASNVLSVALAARLSGRPLTVDYDSACNLNWVRLD